MNQPAPITITHMADLVSTLIRRCTMRDGSPAGVAQLVIEADDVRILKAIEVKLARIADSEQMNMARPRR
jgi:hypothetical protein